MDKHVETLRAMRAFTRELSDDDRAALSAAIAALQGIEAAEQRVREESARLDFIERTFSGMTNRERYLPVQMIWGKGANGRTLREACDKYMQREAGTGSGSAGG